MDRLALRGSPRNARSTLLSNELVKPLIADTTTTGFASAAAKTIFATLRKAFASSMDVPPNFITVGSVRITQTKNSCRAYEMLSQFPTQFVKGSSRRTDIQLTHPYKNLSEFLGRYRAMDRKR